MSHIIVSSMEEEQNISELLDKSVPTYRQAYSDRTAWLMSCLSDLVYIKFNPLLSAKQKESLEQTVEAYLDRPKSTSLYALIERFSYDHEEEKQKLIEQLTILNFELIQTFDSKGTQAILLSSDKFYVLVFRGTEPTDIRDIKTDIKAMTTHCETGGMIHKGFNDAFDEVKGQIGESLNADTIQPKPLFITGHSLGGALATVAAKKLTFKHGIAGCYTFGSPRVADEEWMKNLKTPIYRIVNSADPVTMLPPNKDHVSVIGWALGFIPHYGQEIRKYILSSFGGYYHVGYMRYLKNVKNGMYKDTELLYSVTFFRRLKAYIFNIRPWKELLSDHSISVYRKKLYFIAERRQEI